MIKFRRSLESDKIQIEKVFADYFGPRDTEDVFNNLDRRYLVAYDTENGNRIIGFAGVIPPEMSSYRGFEIDWSCTLKEYAHTSLLSNLLLEVTRGCDQDIYCESLRVEGKPETDLLRHLKKLGFELLVEAKNLNSSDYCSDCDKCSMRNDNEVCNCCWDLYVKEVSR